MQLRDLMPRSLKRSIVPRDDSPFSVLQRQINHVFEDFGRGWPLSTTSWGEGFGEFWPAVDVHDKDNTVDITAEMPGMTDKDITLQVAGNNDLLLIRGEKKVEEERTEGSVFRSERSYGAFQRSIPLPSPIEPERVEATFHNGVLRVKMPKVPEAQRGIRQIPVHSA